VSSALRRMQWLVVMAGLLASGCGSDKTVSEAPASPSKTEDDRATPEPAAAAETSVGGGSDSSQVFGGRPFEVKQLPPGTRTEKEAREAAQELLSAVLDREASSPGNAWALAHGILAKGKDFKAADGRRAVDVLIDDFLLADALPGMRGMHPYFPKKQGDIRVEPHTDLVLKTLVEAGFPLDELLVDRMGAPTLERLFRSSRLRFQPSKEGPSLFQVPDDAPWSAQAWCQGVQKGADPAWRTASGQSVNVGQVAEDLLSLLEREYAFLAEARQRGETVKKQRQHIFSYACGGAHLFQGVAACVAAGQPTGKQPIERLQSIIDLYLFRIPLETGIVDGGMRQAPRMAPILLNQDVKFLGHALEGLSLAQKHGIWTPTEEEVRDLDRAEARMAFHIHQLSRMGAYEQERMQRLTKTDGGFQFYLDLVGDAAHAYRGMALRDELKGRGPLLSD